MAPWWIEQLAPSRPGFWVLTGLLLFAGIEFLSRRTARHSAWLHRAAWLLIPYCALLVGAVSPRLMGLTLIDWRTSLTLGVVLTAMLVALLAAARLTAAANTTEQIQRPLSLPAAFLTAGAEEFHWAFLRGAMTETLLRTPFTLSLPHYWAAWLAGGLALLELFARTPATQSRLVTTIILVSTTVLFVYTQNFWLCWLAHTMIRTILSDIAPRRTERPTPLSPQPRDGPR